LTTENLKGTIFLAIGGDRMEVLHGGQNHKYLGKKMPFGKGPWWVYYQRWQMNCCVEPCRRIGHPTKRWDDQNEFLAQDISHSSWFQAANYETWSSHEKTFVQWRLER